jgi:uncharacterized membrane protein YhaH (DUF805 family)
VTVTVILFDGQGSVLSLGTTLFAFRGRIPRRQYLAFSLLASVIAFLAIALAAVSLDDVGDGMGGLIGFAFMILLVIAAIWSGCALMAKRLHDLGWSGFHAVWIYGLATASGAAEARSPEVAAALGLVPLLVYAWLLAARGNAGENRYGPPPAGTAAPPPDEAASIG